MSITEINVPRDWHMVGEQLRLELMDRLIN